MQMSFRLFLKNASKNYNINNANNNFLVEKNNLQLMSVKFLYSLNLEQIEETCHLKNWWSFGS